MNGLRFVDNNLTIPWKEENGNATFSFSTFPLQLSICTKINLKFARYASYAGFLYIQDIDTENILINIEISNRRDYNFLVEFPGRSGEFEWQFGSEKLRANFLRKWTSFCFSMDYKRESANLTVNGRNIKLKDMSKLSLDVPTCRNCRLVLGHFWRDSNPLIGDILDFTVWNLTLTDGDMKAFSDCKMITTVSGNFIGSVSDMKLEGNLIQPINVPLETAQCKDHTTNFILFVPSKYYTFQDAINSCHKLRYGTMGKIFSDLQDFFKFYEDARNNRAIRKHSWRGGRIQMWMPFLSRTSERSSEDFVHYIGNKTLPREVWMKHEPKRKSATSQTLIYLGNDPAKTRGYNGVRTWYPVSWSPASSFCTLPNTEYDSVVVMLRGLCKNSVIDMFYQVRNDERGYVTYYGFENTIIYYQDKEDRWALKLANNAAVTGTVMSSLNSLALGTHLWTVHNDDKCGRGIVKIPLSLTTCQEEEFTCHDGLCVPLENRCDGEPDCDDASDEVHCRFTTRSNSYQQHLSPPPIDGSSSRAVVNISVNIKTIQEIDELESVFQVQFWLQMLWMDKRLTFFNLKQLQSSNTLTEEEKRQIWVLVLTFINTENQE